MGDGPAHARAQLERPRLMSGLIRPIRPCWRRRLTRSGLSFVVAVTRPTGFALEGAVSQ